MSNIYLIVPFYNEGNILIKVIKELQKYFTNIICIDDGSDKKFKIKKKLGIHLIQHPINLGQGAALQTGITFALEKKAKIIVTYDADGQHSCKDVLAMIK